ncbi:MAG: thymidylate kinase [Myxococcota bacterium]|nr:thymidylate kinase [Myxococcota bacterium]
MLERLNPSHKQARQGERPYPGVLVIVEGLDGSGKSTQLHLLHRWLELEGYPTYHPEWNSSPLVKAITSRSKKRRALTSFTFSLLHAADFADRCERQILPLLQAGYIVLADRYLYTAMVRDAARNCPVDWVAGNYSFAPTPDLALYYRTPLEVSLKRILRGRPALKWHEAGMDLGLSHDPLESFRLYQGRLQKYYDELAEAGYLTILDATNSVPNLQKQTRDLFVKHIDLNLFERAS